MKKIVRISFRRRKTKKGSSFNVHIMIGSELCDQIGLKVGQKATLLVDNVNLEDWLIKKSIKSIDGYTLQKAPGCLKLIITWDKFVPSEEDMKLRNIEHEFYDGGVRMNIGRERRGCDQEKILDNQAYQECVSKKQTTKISMR